VSEERFGSIWWRVLSREGGPALLAVLLAVVSMPFVAATVGGVSTLPADTRNGGVVWLDFTSLGLWLAVAGATLSAALIAGYIGGLITRWHTISGVILTFLMAWTVAIATLPLVPALFHQHVGFAFVPMNAEAAITSDNPSTGLQMLVFLPLSVLSAPIPAAILAIGVVIWARLVRRYRPDEP
jgi:succinate dehydrogenase/fumarate reductase cytochrome b subunit